MKPWTPPADAEEVMPQGSAAWTPPADAEEVMLSPGGSEKTPQRKLTAVDRARAKAHGAGTKEYEEKYGQLGPQRAIPGLYGADVGAPSVNQGIFTEGGAGSGMFQAGVDFASVISRVVPLGASGDDFQHLQQDVEAARRDAGEGSVERFVRGATRSLMPMALGAKVRVPGLPAATAPIALGSAIQGSQSLTEARDQGLPEGQALAFAGKAAAVEAASELLFARFLPTAEKVVSGAVKPTIGNLRGFAGEMAKTAASEYGQEAATEYLHSANEWLSNVNVGEHEWTPKGFLTLLKRMNEAGMQGAFLGGGLGAANAGANAVEQMAERLGKLREVRAKGYVSAEDGQLVGVPGETRKERLTNADAEIQQLEKEIQNAVQSPEVRQPEVPQEAQAQAPEAPQVQVEPQTAPDDRKALLDAFGAAEAAVPVVEKQQPTEAPPAIENEESPWQKETRETLSKVPAFADSGIELDEAARIAKIARKDGRSTTIHFGADEDLQAMAKKKGRKGAKGAYVYKAGKVGKYQEGHIYLRSDAGHGTLNHEAVHWLEDEGIITQKEVEQYGGREGIASKYAEWIASKDRKPETVLQKIYDFLEPMFSSQRRLFEEIGKRQSEVSPAAPAPVVEQQAAEQPQAPAEQPKTRMDMILDKVEESGAEMTVQVEGATPDVLDRAIKAANDRGMWVTTDGNNLLIRPKELELPTNERDVDAQAKIDERVGKPLEVVQPPAPPPAAPKRRGRKEQAVAEPAAAPRRGEIGGMLGTGEVVLTSSGRPTTPFPKVSTGTDRKTGNTLKAVDQWLLQNAIDEAKSRGDDYNLTIFSGETAKNLPQASKDSMEQYLFGEQPAVPKPFTKPLVSPKPTQSAAEKPVEPPKAQSSALLTSTGGAQLPAKGPVEPAVEPEPKAEPPAKAEAPTPLPGLPPPLTHHRGPTTAEDKAFWESMKQQAAERRVAIEDSKVPMQKELDRTRRNAHKKRGTLESQIKEKNRALAVADKEFRDAQNKLAYARLEAIIDNPPSPEHAWAAHARLNDLLADDAQETGDYKQKQKYRDIHDEAVLKLLPFAEAAVREAGLVDKQDVERAAHTAVDRFSSRPDDYKTIADAAPLGIEAVRRERMGGSEFATLDQARKDKGYAWKPNAYQHLSSKELDDLTTKLQEAVKDDANWREKTKTLFDEAKAKNAALEKKSDEEKAKKTKLQDVPANKGPVSESRFKNELWQESFAKAKAGEYFTAQKKNPEPNSYSAFGIYYKTSNTEAVVIEGENYLTEPKKEVKALNAGKTKLQQAADDAVQEARAAEDDLKKLIKKKGSQPTALLDPEVAAAASRVVTKWVKAGTLKFSALIEQLAKSIGQAAVDRIRPALEVEWDRLQKSDSSMEPRTPESQAEPPPVSGDDLTSIKKAVVNEMRELVGLPEMEGSTAQTVEEWVERARITLAADPKAAIRLVNELAVSGRAITQDDAMLLQFRYRELANKLAPVVDEYFAAKKSQDPVAIATAKTALVNARKEMTDFEETIRPWKETWGRTGVALQQMLRKDFSVEAVLRRGQEANEGEELTPDQTAELTAMAKKFQELQSQFEAQRKKNEELEAELASNRQHEEAVTEVKREKVHRKSDKRAAAEKKVADAWERFRQAATSTAGSSGANLLGPAVDVAKAYVELGYVRFSEFMASVKKNMPDADKKLFREAWDKATADAGIEVEKLDKSDKAELSKAAREIQRELVEAGMTDREAVIDAVHEALQEEVPDITRRQTMDALSRYGIFQRQSQDEIEKLIRGMNSEILKLSQIDQMETAMKRVDELREEGKSDEEIGKALEKENLLVEATGLVRDRPSQTVRQLTQKYNELKKSIPATPAGKSGMLQTTLNQMERALRNRISDLKYEIARREKVVKEKRERPTSETIKALETERDSLVQIHKEMFPPKKPSEAQRIASAIRGSDKAIAALEKQIANQDFDVEAKPKLSSRELDARRARLEQLRAHRKALKAMEAERMEGEGGRPTGKVPLSDAELARRAYESSLRSRIADYKDILAKGDFSPQPKKAPRTLTDSELKLLREMEDVRHEVLQKYADYHLAHLNGIAWGADKLAETTRLSRALLTFVDLPLLRQGALVTYGRPGLGIKAMRETFTELAGTFGGMKIDSRQAEFNVMHKLAEGPAGEFRQKAGLELPTSDQKITKQEEAFQGRWAKYFPGVSLGGRLYTMIMNTLRANMFDLMVENIGRNGQVTIEEGKLLAHFVNIATGRSDLKGVPFFQALEQQSHLMNEMFFATRWVASRFQYLAMPFYLPFKGGVNQNWRVKRAIYQEMGRQFAGAGVLLGAIALAVEIFWDDDDEDKPYIGLNPTSSDFLKVRWGESRIDFMAGFSQIFVLSARIAMGRTTSSVSGKTRKFGEGGEPPTYLSTVLNFGRTKLAPVPGAVTTIANDWTNVVGGKETPLSLATGLFSPISLVDVYKSMQTQGIPKGTALAMIGELGAATNTYGPRTEYVTGTPEQRQAQIEEDLKNMQWDSPEQPAYSEFLTGEQLEQFRQRRQEKRGLVVHNATYSGENEDELKTRDKNRKQLEEMGVSKDEALDLLIDYYKIKEGGVRVRGGTGLKPGYKDRLRELGSIYEK